MTSTISDAPAGIDLEQLHGFVVALRNGNFSARLPITEGSDWRSVEIATLFNAHIEQMGAMISQIKRVAGEVGIQGKLGPQAEHYFGPGPWKDFVESINVLAANLTDQLRDFNRSVALMAQGNYTRPVTCRCQGETLQLKDGLNALMDRQRRAIAMTRSPNQRS